ncbi:Ig-like domain-containing protein [Thalassoroseus pseudoceratinae]|uniref:Ig-like domain-containing protein n=1 Tax=Thalassoroseus pseudoceratinae TaxID=2713176 RepID=UPI00141E07A3|nr:Ig-like domain-containing protein [Thalassoroseus pseudoceratinae]
MQLEQRRVLAAPIAIDDVYFYDPTTSISYSVPFDSGVLANDTDADDDSLSATLIDPPLDGQVFLNTDGSFEYIAGRSFSGFDSFTYQAFDGSDFSNLAYVSIESGNGNGPPPSSSVDGPPTSFSFQVNTLEDTPTVIEGLAISPTTTGPSTDYIAQVSVDSATQPNGGLLFFGTLEGLTILDGANDTGFIEFAGSENDINAALDTLVFLPTLDFSGTEHIRFDYQSQSAAFPESGSIVVDVDVEAVADRPILLVPDPVVYTDPGQLFPIPIDAFSNDIDGSENVFVTMIGVPDELELSLGLEQTDQPGVFEFRDGDWELLDAVLQPGGAESFTITFTAFAIENDNNDIASESITVEFVRIPSDAPPPDDEFVDDGFFDDEFYDDEFILDGPPPGVFEGDFFYDDFHHGLYGPEFGNLEFDAPDDYWGDLDDHFWDDLFLPEDLFDFDDPEEAILTSFEGQTGSTRSTTDISRPSHSGLGDHAGKGKSGKLPLRSAASGSAASTQSLGLVSNLRPQEIGRRNESLLRPPSHRGQHPVSSATSDSIREEISGSRNHESGLYARALNAKGETIEDVRLPDQLADDYSRFLKFLRELPNGDYVVYFLQPGQTMDQAAQRQRLLDVRVVNGRLNPNADEFKPAGELSRDDVGSKQTASETVAPIQSSKADWESNMVPVEKLDSADAVSVDSPVSGLIGVGLATQLASVARRLRVERDRRYQTCNSDRSWRGRKFRRKVNARSAN